MACLHVGKQWIMSMHFQVAFDTFQQMSVVFCMPPFAEFYGLLVALGESLLDLWVLSLYSVLATVQCEVLSL